MLAEYKASLERHQADPRKEKRREVMKERATEDHHQGTRQVLISLKH